jgi:hypothetical protein
MLVKLTPDQVSLYWPALEEAIEQTIPRHPSVSMLERNNKILAEMLNGDIEAWLGIEEEDGGRKLTGTLFTRLERDRILLTRNLLIYSAYAPRNLGKKLLLEYLAVLEKYGRSRNCDLITCFTNNPQFVQIMKARNANIQFRYITLQL